MMGIQSDNHDVDRTSNQSSATKKVVALECATFREDVRAEWIRAVFGTEFPRQKRSELAAAQARTTAVDLQRTATQKNNSWKGVGLARISSYVAYTADLELCRSSSPSLSISSPVENSPVVAVNNHGDDHANQTVHTTMTTNGKEKNEHNNKSKRESVPEQPLLLLESQQLLLGMTLSRLSLGLFVRTVHAGSEAWCAGVEENSVLVGINDGELNLLAEPSKSALERIWQYEGYCCDRIGDAGAKDRASRESDPHNMRFPTSTTNKNMKIRDPISMTFIRCGKLYKVIFLSDPPYGIDWGPCGNFCLVQRVKTGGIADRAGVRPSSIVARIDTNKIQECKGDEDSFNGNNTIYHLDHSSVAMILKDATTFCVPQQQIQNNHNHNIIRIQLCFPPQEARSGHWERQQDALEKKGSNTGASGGNSNASSNNEKNMRLPQQHMRRPRVAAELDGVQVRIHPLMGGRGNMISNSRRGDASLRRSRSPNNHRKIGRSNFGNIVSPSSSLSTLAERVAAGENLSILRNSDRRNMRQPIDPSSSSSSGAEYGRLYRPCPILKKSSSLTHTNTQQLGSSKQPNQSTSSSIPSLLDCWDVQQAFIYIFRYHLVGYNEIKTRIRASKDTDFLKVLDEYLLHSPDGNSPNNKELATVSDALSTFLIFWLGWLTTKENKPLELTEYLLKLVHQNQIQENKARRISGGAGHNFSSDSSSSSLAYHLEFLAGAFDNSDIKASLRKLRKERQQRQRQHLFEKPTKRIADSRKGSGKILPSIRAVTGTTPVNRPATQSKYQGTIDKKSVSALKKAKSSALVKSRSRRLFRFFPKTRRFRDKKTNHNTSKNASENISMDIKLQPSLEKDKTISSPDDGTESSPSVTSDEKFSSPKSCKTELHTLHNPKSPSLILKELSDVVISHSTDSLFSNTLWFLGELELVCIDIEKSLMRSFSQKFARWALQPWTATKESTLTNVTNTMRERLKRCNKNDSSMPLLDPIACEPLSSIDTNGCYILPSAHFPLLLTFDCKRKSTDQSHVQEHDRGKLQDPRDCHDSNKNTRSILFGEERIYRTTVKLIALKGSRIPESNGKILSRGFTVHGSVSGSVVESQQSIGVDQESNSHIWNQTNLMVFDSRSTWGPPQTLSLRLSETILERNGKKMKASIDSDRGRISSQKEYGYCWVNLTPYWEQLTDNREPQSHGKTSTKFDVGKNLCKSQVLPFDAFTNFNEHGDLPAHHLPENMELPEIELQITTKILESKSSVKRSLLYKHDDDVRQEMFAIEFITSCDRILRSCGLDMKMLIFRCISVGRRRGFIEWVQGSIPLSEICQPFAGSILAKKNDKTKKLKSISTECNPPEADEEAGDDVEDDNITLSSVAKAGMAKYEPLSRLRNDDKSSLKQPTGGSTYVLPKNNNPIQDFLRSLAYDPVGSYKIKREVMDTFVKSCAGYSVCTYVLGVGDRHLDNLLLHESGHFFHCDYSFILGKDPKKYLPMRITKDMINGLGGWKSDNFCQFLSLACAAFLTLRRPENVRHLLSLIRLLEGCGLPDLENTQTIETAIEGVRARLKLDLNDEEAIAFMEKLIQDSCSSKMWIAVDAIHSLAQRF